MTRIKDYSECVNPTDTQTIPIDPPHGSEGETQRVQLFNIVSAKHKEWLRANGFVYTDSQLCVHGVLPNNFAIASGGGKYNWMVEIPRKNWDPTNGFASAEKALAFTVNNLQKRIFIGKYIASKPDTEARSLPNQIPLVGQTFDQQLTQIAALNSAGVTGWHMMTNAEWALVAQISKGLGVTVYGNNNYGRDVDDKSVTFRMSDPTLFGGSTGDGKSYTGSGGHRTSHNNQLDGIFDLNGNVWERVNGLRLNNSEIQIFVNNDAADLTKDFSAGSASWKAILDDASLVAPGTAGTLKIAANGNITKTAPGSTSSSKTFESVDCESDVSSSSAGIALLKKLGLYPYTTGLGSDTFYYNTSGEFIALRGGGWYDGTSAGLFNMYLGDTRANSYSSIGIRLAFVL